MSFSIVVTVLNEANTIRPFLDSLTTQELPPAEIMIVDGGSSDGTEGIIDSYAERGFPVKLIVAPGANIARGRNIGISAARYDIIAVTDAGCVIEPDWSKNLIKHFRDPSVSVVAGHYRPLVTLPIHRLLAVAHVNSFPNPKRFTPSSRSIAFRKEAWLSVGGYPEWLLTAEDTLFNLNMARRGFRTVFEPNAVVHWRLRDSWKAATKQYFRYALGDGQAHIQFGFYTILFGFYLALAVTLIVGTIYWQVSLLSLLLLCGYLTRRVRSLNRLAGLSVKDFLSWVGLVVWIDVVKLYGFARGFAQMKGQTS